MNQLDSVLPYLRNCLKAYKEDYSQTIKVWALDALLDSFEDKGFYFPLLAPETERHIERESNTQRSRLTDQLTREPKKELTPLAEKAWQKLVESDPGVLLALQRFLNRDQAETVYPVDHRPEIPSICAWCGHPEHSHYTTIPRSCNVKFEYQVCGCKGFKDTL